jgi:hypothetical protein
MTKLTDDEVRRLYQLLEKAKKKEASSTELKEIVGLILRSDARTQYEIEQYINRAGFTSLDELHRHIEEKKSQEFIDTLIAIGLGMLVGYVIIKWASEKRAY